MLDWRNWARAVIGLPVEWSKFYVTNAVVVGLGIAQAMLAPTLPLAPTAVVLMVPVATAVWRRASADGALDFWTGTVSVIGGAALMASPIVMLRIKSKPYFRQDR
jgi:hypothetical protein